MSSGISTCRMLLVDRMGNHSIYRDPFNFERITLTPGQNPKTLLIKVGCNKVILKRDLKDDPIKCPNKECGKIIEPINPNKHYFVIANEHIEKNKRLYQAARVRVLPITTKENNSFYVAVNPYTNEVISYCKTSEGKTYYRPRIDLQTDVKVELGLSIYTDADVFFKDIAMTQCGHFFSLAKDVPEVCPENGCEMPLHKEQIQAIDTYEEPEDEVLVPPAPLPVIKEDPEVEEAAEVDGDDTQELYYQNIQPYAPQLGQQIYQPFGPQQNLVQKSNLIATKSAVIAAIVATIASAGFFAIEAVVFPSKLLLLAGRFCVLAGMGGVSIALSNALIKISLISVAFQVGVLWRAYAINCKELYVLLAPLSPYLATASIILALSVPIIYNISNNFLI